MVAGNCNFDLSALIHVVPSGTPLENRCASTCGCNSSHSLRLSSSTTIATSLKALTGLQDLSALADYSRCLQTICVDASPTFLTTVTGGFCTRRRQLQLSSTHIPSFQSGPLLNFVCPTLCDCGPCSGVEPPGISNVVAVGQYFGCLQSNCTMPQMLS